MIPDALLEQSHFVRSLAQSLVLDENHAEDIVQKAWVIALRKPPRYLKSPRGWLSTVVRNLVRMENRDAVRRMKREKVVAQPEVVDSSDDILETLHQRKMVLNAVQQLKEPYLSAILLRYYDDLPPRQIAEKLNVPVATAKTWVQRGQDKIRQHLDERYNGDRKAWIGALAPLAGLTVAGSAGSAAAAAGSAAEASVAAPAAASVNAAGLKIGIAAAAAAALVLLSILWFQLPQGDGTTAVSDPAQAGTTDVKRDSGALAESEMNSGDDLAREPLLPSGTRIAGRVVDLLTGKPVREFEVGIRRTGVLLTGPSARLFSGKFENINGEFVIRLSGAAGDHVIWASSPGHRTAYVELDLKPGESRSDLLVQLDPGMSVAGIVVDGDTGNPVANALVGVEGLTSAVKIRCGLPGGGIHTWTDRDGFFRLEGLEGRQTVPVTILAAHPDYAQGSLSARFGDENAAIFLSEGRCVTGIIRDDSGNPAPGIAVCVEGIDDYLSWPVLTGPDGRYELTIAKDEIRPLRLSAFTLPERDDDLLPDKDVPAVFTPETKVLITGAHDSAILNVDFGPSDRHITLSGTLRDGSDDPLPGGQIYFTPLMDPSPPLSTGCDETGAFELRKLQRGRPYFVTVYPPGGRFEITVNQDLVLDDDPSIGKDICIAPGTISGTIRGDLTGAPLASGVLEARPASSPHRVASRCIIDESGRFTLYGLEAGTYRLQRQDPTFLAGEYLMDWIDPVTIGENGDTEITLEEGQVLGDLELTAPSKGIALIKGTGFKPEDMHNIGLEIISASKDSRAEPIGFRRIGRGFMADGSISLPVAMPPGAWDVYFSLGSTDGKAARRIHVSVGEVTETVIRRTELVDRTNSATVAGTVLNTDGTPVTGMKIRFSRIIENAPPGHPEYLECRTDSSGCYLREGLSPGDWIVSIFGQDAAFLPSYRIFFPMITVPENPPALIPLDLERPSGMITATLRDENSNLTITEDHPWIADVIDVATGRKVFRKSLWGPNLELGNLPPGELRLSIQVNDYELFDSESIPMAVGQILNIGEIALHPRE